MGQVSGELGLGGLLSSSNKHEALINLVILTELLLSTSDICYDNQGHMNTAIVITVMINSCPISKLSMETESARCRFRLQNI